MGLPNQFCYWKIDCLKFTLGKYCIKACCTWIFKNFTNYVLKKSYKKNTYLKYNLNYLGAIMIFHNKNILLVHYSCHCSL